MGIIESYLLVPIIILVPTHISLALIDLSNLCSFFLPYLSLVCWFTEVNMLILSWFSFLHLFFSWIYSFPSYCVCESISSSLMWRIPLGMFCSVSLVVMNCLFVVVLEGLYFLLILKTTLMDILTLVDSYLLSGLEIYIIQCFPDFYGVCENFDVVLRRLPP
jgi:hypothetical protein